ncbi:MAG: hypothetical protein QF835_06020 [Candidatus Marinimicrobia bacterium]|jgi:hypothetical protein|nr:hypothetical protein [Candidatus Neomarinimicrobiota bacterium]MDP6820766.1 hypothetical protein [Candidatus Neomarinimicrobiota bacterium]MED5316605.1 hypothetical protein [Candidatus Neomarinimicrobiota bacterium]|tara:strand:+ start:1094 stop:1489 length:396 start_codon:yes stop_codon:yes gene_type:complete
MKPYEFNKKIVIILLPLVLLMGFFYFFNYRETHTDWTEIKPQISLSAKELLQRYQINEKNNLTNIVVQVSGMVTALDDSLYILDKAVVCKPAADIKFNINKKEFVTVKGRCLGYDDLLMEVRLDHVVVIEL